MDIRNFFNIILLALSLTTIFITLISYIVFKLRQASTMTTSNDLYMLEGSYFRRYAPELEKANDEKRIEMQAKERNPKRFYVKILSMFAFVFLIIFSVFLVEEYYHNRFKTESVIPANNTEIDQSTR